MRYGHLHWKISSKPSSRLKTHLKKKVWKISSQYSYTFLELDSSLKNGLNNRKKSKVKYCGL